METTRMTPPDRVTVAIYLRYYLPISMTFVHRQLQGVSQRFRPIVLTSELSNTDVFPFEPVYTSERSFFNRVQSRVSRIATGRYAVLPNAQQRDFHTVLTHHRVRLIHAHFGHYGLEILPVARELRIPLLVTFHGVGASVLLKDAAYVRQLPELFAYARVIAASKATAERLLKVGADPESLSVHYIGVPVDRFAYVERKPPRAKVENGETIHFVQVSNFVEVKGHRYTLDAFARLLEYYPNCVLTLAGDGPTRPEMEAKCRTLGISERVRFAGRVTTEDVVALMQTADVSLLHSVTPPRGDIEAAATVVAEAMSSGAVVVASRHGGIPEMIEDGVNGFLVDERDVESYVGQLRNALGADGAMGRRAAETVRAHFNLAVQNEALCNIYQEMIERGV